MLMWNKLRSVAAAPTRLAEVIFEVYQQLLKILERMLTDLS
jgi:hypothetical protein